MSFRDMLFGGKGVVMKVKADVDVEVETALGSFKVRKIPAEGRVEVKKAYVSMIFLCTRLHVLDIPCEPLLNTNIEVDRLRTTFSL